MVAVHAARLLVMWTFVAALTFSLGCEKAMETSDPNAEIKEIYFLSYLPGQVQPVQGYVMQALHQQRHLFTETQFAAAEKVVAEQMQADKLEVLVLENLVEQEDRTYLKEALEWLKRPEVRKFTALKSAGWTSEGMNDMKDFFLKERDDPPSAERLALVERYDQATNFSGLSAETMLLSAFGVAVLHDSVRPEEDREGPKRLQEDIVSQRIVLKPIFKETSIVTHRFAFSQSTDEQLRAAVEFVESKPGQWLHTTISTSFLNAVLHSTAELGFHLAEALPGSPES